jgi:hypothetical protein
MSKFTLSVSFFRPHKYEVFSDCINEITEFIYDNIGPENNPNIEFTIKDLEKEYENINLKIKTEIDVCIESFRIFSNLISERYKDSISIKKISLIFSQGFLFKKEIVLVRNKLIDSCRWCGNDFDYEKGCLDYCNKSCKKIHTKNNHIFYQESEVI